MIPARPFCVALLCCVLIFAGCSLEPPFTQQEASDRIVTILREKYNLQAHSMVVGNTVQATMDIPEMLQHLTPEGNLAQNDALKIGDLLIVTTQMCLSTKTPFTFYLLRVLDSSLSGAEIRYITYLDDIRRLYAGALNETEFFARRVQEVKLTTADTILSDVWLQREPQLGEFLAVQCAARMKALAFEENSAVNTWGLEDSSGWYGDRTITMQFARAAEHPDHPVWPEDAFALMARILHEYQFTDFDTVIFNDLTTERTLALARDELERYRIPR